MPMSKRKPTNDDAPRRGHARAAGELVGDVGGMAFRKFGFMQASVVSRWNEIVGQRYAQVSLPESIRFPAGKKAGGTLTLLVEGAHAPLIQHLGPLIIERVNRFFGYEAIAKVVFRQGRLPAPAAKHPRPQPAPLPQELGEGLRAVADPELRACLTALAGHIGTTTGPPVIETPDEKPIPIIRSLPK
jgi:hypothetical protein